jgi:integrase
MKGSRPLNRDEISTLRSLFFGRMGVRNQALFFFGANTGFRISELLSLRLEDVLEKSGVIKDRVTVSKRNMKGKTKSRSVILNEQAKKSLLPWLVKLRNDGIWFKDEPVFISIRHDRAISRVQAWRVLTTAYRAAGLTGKLGTHAMRKTFANNIYDHLLKRVADGEAIDAFRGTSKALGHADIKSTDKYLSFRTGEIDKTILATGV